MNTGLTAIALAAILGGVILLIVSAAASEGGNELLKQFEPAAQIISSIVLIGTVVVLYIQLGHIQEQNDLQRAVASKSAIQELNKVLLDKQQEDFLRFVFPKLIDTSNGKSGLTPGENLIPGEEQARKIMMAFSLMNSLELLYLARDEKVEREDFKRLLRGFTANVRELWNDDFATVYHPDFQKIVEEVFEENQAQQADAPGPH